MVHKLLLHIALAASLLSRELPGASATKTKTQVKNNSGVTPAGQCGTWIKESEGGYFTSPNYPEKYPPERECVYIIEASPRQCIDLFFDEKYSIEPSWECKFDHIEVRDGPFVFSPILGRFCGPESPSYVRSSGRYLYIKFVADGELEAMGFSAHYNFTQDPEFTGAGELPALPFCEFELSGPEGFVESGQIAGESRALQTEAVDCRWFIKAPPRARIYLRFLEYEMHNSNECKRNFVAIYDGSSSVEHLKNKFCSTVANDVMLVSSVGVLHVKEKLSFAIATCASTKRWSATVSRTVFSHGTRITAKRKGRPVFWTHWMALTWLLSASPVAWFLSCSSSLSSSRDDFDPALLHPGFEPPHYELCTLRRTPSGDLNDAAMAEDYEKFHKLRRSSSKCIRDHHCGSFPGSMHGSVHGSRSNLSMRDATIVADGGGLVPPPLPPGMGSQQSPHLSQHTTPAGHRSILMMKHSYSQDGAEGYRAEEDEDFMMDDGPTTSQQRMYHHHMHHGTSGQDHTVHRTLSNDF
ncbi:neuropilin and tolloid-like protein 1 isoform X2 [Gymnodraco acuticeps]|uniref:Neuropilin and tolloid-like protein 1 isoform X2 n=1 Tax=Gymnodraco acuticeps TaxID=8218 RepID=A0A6P8SVJ3_GYMAC|nr:neuropilin and tolloid-like protein 1 isoform X2 [Gymnodraco acuticeps]